jgi:hypothetical protein
MDKVARYKKIARQVAEGVANFGPPPIGIEYIRVYDEADGQFTLFTDGWDGGNRLYGCFLHFDIHKDGKIWIRQDGTDLAIVDDLLEAGVPKEDIVLAFYHPKMRQYSEFAVA